MVVGKLYTTAVSPAGRAVQLATKALDIQVEHVEVNLLKGDHLKPEYVKLNPQHTIPMFIDQDGTTLWDSHAIMAYLVGKYGKSDALYPKQLAQRAVVDQRLHFDSGNVFAHLRLITIQLMQHGEKPTERQIEQAKSLYDFLNVFLNEKEWMAGGQLTIADFSLIASVSSMCNIIPIEPKYFNLLTWMKRCEKLPYYTEANGNGAETHKGFVQSLLNK